MGDPRRGAPTLQNIAIELTSAMSSLNMPEPESCPPIYVKHAYEHLCAAAEMISELMGKQDDNIHAALERGNRQFLENSGMVGPHARPRYQKDPEIPSPRVHRGRLLAPVVIDLDTSTPPGSLLGPPRVILMGWFAAPDILLPLLDRLNEEISMKPDTNSNREVIRMIATAFLQHQLDVGNPFVFFEGPKERT